MKKALVSVLVAAMTFGTISTASAEEGDLSNQILRSVIQGAVGTQDGFSAQDNQWFQSVGSRMDAIDRRIELGVGRGDLSRTEARDFRDTLNDLVDDIDRMKKEGQVSQREKDSINRSLDKLERKVPVEPQGNVKRKRY